MTTTEILTGGLCAPWTPLCGAVGAQSGARRRAPVGAMCSYACAVCVAGAAGSRGHGGDTPRTTVRKYQSARVGVRRVRGR
jgi:hypothetical protein